MSVPDTPVRHTGPVSRLSAARTASAAEPSLPREVYVLGLIAFCVAVGFGVLVPVLPVFARSFGVGNLQVGAVISAFALMRLVSSPFCGRLINLLGERIVMATGIFIVAISSGLAGISHSYVQLLVLRGVGGHRIGHVHRVGVHLAAHLGRLGLRGRAAGFFQGGFLIGGMTGPAVGGLLSAISLTAPFFFYAGTLAVAGTVGLVLLRTRGERPDEADAEPVIPFRQVLRDARYQAACFTNLAQGWTSFGVRSSLVPVLVVEVLHRPTVVDRGRVRRRRRGPDHRRRSGRSVRGHRGPPPGDDRGRVGGRGVDAAGPVRPQHLAADRRALRVRGGLGLPRYGPGRGGRATPRAASGGTAVAVFSMCADIGAIVGPLVAGLLADYVSYPAAFARRGRADDHRRGPVVADAAYPIRRPAGRRCR